MVFYGMSPRCPKPSERATGAQACPSKNSRHLFLEDHGASVSNAVAKIGKP